MMRVCAIVSFALVLVGLWAAPAYACPGCQNPNLPMTRESGVVLAEGSVRLGFQFGVTALEVVHEAGCRDLTDCHAIPMQPFHYHEQVIIPSQIEGVLEWGLTNTWGVEAKLPVRTVASTINYSTVSGDPYEPIEGNIHHRNEVLVGLGDASVALRGSWMLGDGWWIIGRLGSSIPFGRTESDPFLAGDNLEEHQHIQFGSGTFDPIVGAEVARSVGRWQGAMYAQFRRALYSNDYGFQAGSRLLAGSQMGYRFGERSVSLMSVEYMRDEPERWSGKIKQDGLLGRHEVLLGIGAAFSFGGPQYTVALRTPVYREVFQGPNVEEGEIFAPIIVGCSISWVM